MALVEITTTQINNFKTTFECISSMLTDINIEITNEGIFIRDVDRTGKIVVSALLDAQKFDIYNFTYNYPKISIGVDIVNIITAVKSNIIYDVLKISVYDTKEIIIELYNKERGETKRTVVPAVPVLTNVNNGIIKSIDYSHLITLPPTTLSKYLKDINGTQSDNVRFVIDANKVLISGMVEEKILTTYELFNNKSLSIVSAENETLTRSIDIKYIIILNKCINLSGLVSLYFANNQPITAAYKLSSLGTLKLVLF
jgi:hypothetical protein